MLFQDEREEKNLKILSYYLKEIENLSFFSSLQDKLQDYCDYFVIMEKIKKNLNNKFKMGEVSEDIQICKNRGFITEEFTNLEKKVNELMDWYKNFEKIHIRTNCYSINDFLFNNEINIKQQLLSEV